MKTKIRMLIIEGSASAVMAALSDLHSMSVIVLDNPPGPPPALAKLPPPEEPRLPRENRRRDWEQRDRPKHRKQKQKRSR